MKYRTCPVCGAALDPQEKCDCESVKKGAVTYGRINRKGSSKAGRRA